MYIYNPKARRFQVDHIAAFLLILRRNRAAPGHLSSQWGDRWSLTHLWNFLLTWLVVA